MCIYLSSLWCLFGAWWGDDFICLHLRGPHIHFNVHTVTQIYRQTHTCAHTHAHYLLSYFHSLIFIPLSSFNPSRPEEDVLHHLFLHICILGALRLPLLPSRFHLLSMLLILFVPVSPAPPPFLTFTPLTGVWTGFSSWFPGRLMKKSGNVFRYVSLLPTRTKFNVYI